MLFTQILSLHIFQFPDISVFELLNKILESMMQDLKSPFLAALTEDIHVLPDFHGNRYLDID